MKRRRPALSEAGQKHVHDDFEEIWVEVAHQERLDQTIRRLDAEIERDERREKAKTSPAPGAASKSPAPPANSRSKPRARSRRSPQRLRDKGTSKKDDPCDQDHSPHNGLLALFAAGLVLTILGAIAAVVVKVVKQFS
jgi:hypothetical protein